MTKHDRDFREVREIKVHRGQRYKLTLGKKTVAKIKIPKKPSYRYKAKEPFKKQRGRFS